jgi:hypothetical protein
LRRTATEFPHPDQANGRLEGFSQRREVGGAPPAASDISKTRGGAFFSRKRRAEKLPRRLRIQSTLDECPPE